MKRSISHDSAAVHRPNFVQALAGRDAGSEAEGHSSAAGAKGHSGAADAEDHSGAAGAEGRSSSAEGDKGIEEAGKGPRVWGGDPIHEALASCPILGAGGTSAAPHGHTGVINVPPPHPPPPLPAPPQAPNPMATRRGARPSLPLPLH
jgi:hypothetical protein